MGRRVRGKMSNERKILNVASYSKVRTRKVLLEREQSE